MTWFCANCSGLTELDQHGRCAHCQSDAVDVAVRPIRDSLDKAALAKIAERHYRVP